MGKIVDEDEVLRWFAEGRDYAWMQAEYERRYNIETTPAMWSNFRRRRGLDRPGSRDTLPWHVEKRHRWAYPLMMLRALDQPDLTEAMRGRLNRWLAERDAEGTVVAYDPASEAGFSYVPRSAEDRGWVRP